MNYISPEQVKEEYGDDLEVLMRVFNHRVVEDEGVWRWECNRLTCHIQDHAPVYTPSAGDGGFHAQAQKFRASIDLNTLWIDFHRNLFSLDELMQFYMGIGYSLGGFQEVFSEEDVLKAVAMKGSDNCNAEHALKGNDNDDA